MKEIHPPPLGGGFPQGLDSIPTLANPSSLILPRPWPPLYIIKKGIDMRNQELTDEMGQKQMYQEQKISVSILHISKYVLEHLAQWQVHVFLCSKSQVRIPFLNQKKKLIISMIHHSKPTRNRNNIGIYKLIETRNNKYRPNALILGK